MADRDAAAFDHGVITGLLGPAAGRPDLAEGSLEEAYAAPPPWLRAVFVAAVDGVIEVGGASGPLGGEVDTEVFATLRALADGVLVGAGTARSENYGPAWLGAGRRDRRAARGQPALPTVAVVSASAHLDPTARLFCERRADQPEPPRPIVLTAASAPAENRSALAEVAEVIEVGDQAVDLRAAVAELRRRGLAGLTCEGGPGLFGDLVAAGLVDELCLTHAPILGGGARATLSGGRPSDEVPSALELTGLLSGSGLLLARYRITGRLATEAS